MSDKEKLVVDYNGNYTLETPTKIVHGDNSVQDLTTMLLAECKFGFAVRGDKPAYELRFSSRSRKSLDKKEIICLKAIVEYYNQIVNPSNSTEYKIRPQGRE